MHISTMDIVRASALAFIAGSAVAQAQTQPDRSQPARTQPEATLKSTQPTTTNYFQTLISRMSSSKYSLNDTIKSAEKHCNGKAVDARLTLDWKSSEGSGNISRQTRIGEDREQDRDIDNETPGRNPNQQGVESGQPQNDSRQASQPGQRNATNQKESDTLYAVVTCLVDGSGAREIVIDMADNSVVNMKPVASLRQGSDYTDRQNELDSATPVMMLRASDIMNVSVKNTVGDDLGRISDLAVDPRAHRVVYGVLTRSGAPGSEDTRYAIRLNDLVGPQDGKIMLNLSDAQIMDEESFDSDNWPTSANTSLSSDRPSGNDRTSTATEILKATDIIGSEITCSDETVYGEIDDIVVDARSGRVVYFILDSYRGDLAIPVSSVTREGDGYQSRLSRSELQTIPTFAAGTNPNWNDASWNRSTHESFGVRTEQSITARDTYNR